MSNQNLVITVLVHSAGAIRNKGQTDQYWSMHLSSDLKNRIHYQRFNLTSYLFQTLFNMSPSRLLTQLHMEIWKTLK